MITRKSLNRLVKAAEGKKRPMQVIISDADIKMELFEHLKKLRGNKEYETVRVAHDMTRRQREHDAALWQEAKNLCQSGKGKYSVRGPPWNRRIVKLVEKGAGVPNPESASSTETA